MASSWPSGCAIATSVVLVDEFQDTDPVQWNIMRRAFGGGRTLVLIGDPKQAIYAFRGADVYAYLDAAREAATQATLEVNYRSDQGLIDAYDALFGGASLGHPGIVYRQVRATPENQEARLTDAPIGAPLRIRVVHRDEVSISTTQGGYARNASAREHIATDLALDLVALLPRREFETPRSRASAAEPGHVAVLVQTNRAAAQVRDALGEAGIPAVINGAGSVFGTAQAREWLRLLEALERPTSEPRAHAAALTAFLGWSAERIAAAADEDWEAVHRRLHHWARVLRASGVASLIETITLAEGLPERVLPAVDGERRLTDLRHVGQLLHAAATTEQLGTTALAAWLRRRIAEADQDTSDEDRSRRLESDAEAVQVLTDPPQQGPRVPDRLLPVPVGARGTSRAALPVAYHDPAAGDRRTIDVGLEGATYEAPQAAAPDRAARGGPAARLRRADARQAPGGGVVGAVVRTAATRRSGGCCSRASADGTVPPAGAARRATRRRVARFEKLAAEAPGASASSARGSGSRPPAAGRAARAAELPAARFDRALDRRWRRTSYSDITRRRARGRGWPASRRRRVLEDEPETPGRPVGRGRRARRGRAARGPVAARGDARPATSVGTFVHRVLEATDFAAADLDAELTARGRRGAGAAAGRDRRHGRGGRGAARGDRDAARAAGRRGAAARRGAHRPARRARLRAPARRRRRPKGRLALDAIAARPARAPPGRRPARRLRGPARGPGPAQHRARLRDRQHRPRRARAPAGRFTVVDYKTNWLAAPGEELTAGTTGRPRSPPRWSARHYGLQALLYTVALHRYLRWRLPRYDPEHHLGGVLYLFVRGMVGPDTPVVDGTPCGVFAWRPPAGAGRPR